MLLYSAERGSPSLDPPRNSGEPCWPPHLQLGCYGVARACDTTSHGPCAGNDTITLTADDGTACPPVVIVSPKFLGGEVSCGGGGMRAGAASAQPIGSRCTTHQRARLTTTDVQPAATGRFQP